MHTNQIPAHLFSRCDSNLYAADRSDVEMAVGVFRGPAVIEIVDPVTGGHRLFQLVAKSGWDGDIISYDYVGVESSVEARVLC